MIGQTMRVEFTNFFRNKIGQRNYSLVFFYFLPLVCWGKHRVYAEYHRYLTIGWLWFTCSISFKPSKK